MTTESDKENKTRGKRIALTIEHIQKTKKASKRQIAIKLDVSPTALDRWVSKGTIKHANAEKLSDLSGYRTEWIYYGTEPMLKAEQEVREEVARYNITATEQRLVSIVKELNEDQTLAVLTVAEQLYKKNSTD